MAPAPSMSVAVECLNVCTLPRGEGSCGGSGGSRYDCCVLSCAWKAPRVLTGSLASTAQSWRSSSLVACRRIRRRNNRVRHGHASPNLGSTPSEASFFGYAAWSSLHVTPDKWSLACSPSFVSETSYKVTPESLWEDLRPAILYLAPIELEFVHKALKLAFEAHDGQKRRSGEPFIIHPVEVARILGELELDWESIAAGLLHDTVEDTDVVTFEKIEKEFGSAVRNIVEGETKVSKLGKLKYKDEEALLDVKADDLRQMFLAMTEEVRVIIVKLADRLHNMRTLSHMPPHKQASIALETLQVFAPLAKLLGMYQIKSELENLSFMYTNAEDYEKIRKKVADLYKKHERDIYEANKILINKIEDDQFLGLVTMKTEVHAVCKEPYSIYKAVVKSRSSIHEVNQIAQLCIVIQPKSGNEIGPLCSAEQICYHVLGLVHRVWTPVPRSMKDYIATPKPNGYQSLHTTVIPFLYESMFRLEVQIRTEEMDLIARRGIATHYSGKEVGDGIVRQTVNGRSSRGKLVGIKGDIGLRICWLNAIRDWQEEFVGNMTSREFVDTITRDLLGSRVFVFTPRGEIKNLPKGATIIDYAYLIHTEIGNRMVAAKVNGNLVSPTHVLANAEVVEIITYDALSNKTAWERQKKWLQHAKTRSARYKIMRFLREQTASSATEVTADSQGNQVVPLPDISRGSKSMLGKTNGSLTSTELSEDAHVKNFSIESIKVNGKPSAHAQNTSLECISQYGIAELLHAKTPMLREVIPGLESWRTSKIAAWHNVEGHSVDWFCIVAIDRRGVMAEVTTVLSSLGISISSCAAEVDRTWGIAVMLYQIEGAPHNLFDACSRIDAILGVLRWSAGCSWQASTETKLVED